MKELNSHIEDLIVTFLAEGLEGEALQELQEWIDATPANKDYFMQQQEIWFSSIASNRRVQYNKEEAFRKFRQRIGRPTKQQQMLRIPPAVYRIAAVALILLISYFSYRQGSKHVESRFADMVVEAPLGSRTRLSLPDGTDVWLNAGSKLTYSQGFGVNDRVLKLSGEAYFEVIRNEKLTFEVNTDELQVKVLGTKFNFRNYANDEEVTVNLMEGKVNIHNFLKTNNTEVLLPNERVVLDKKTSVMTKSSAKAANAMEWTNGYLFFDEELLPDIARRLERSYNVHIVIADESLLAERFYGNFVRQEQSIEEVLTMLASTQRLKYKTEGNTITLYEYRK